MKRTLTAVEARKRLGELLEGVYYRGDEVIIERAGKPMAVVIPAAAYEQIEKRRQKFWAMIEDAQQRNKDVAPEVLEAEIDQAIDEARSEMRGGRRVTEEKAARKAG